MSILLGAFLLISQFITYAATDEDVDRLTTYAVVLGRAIACGVDVKDASSRVGSWMDRTFSNKEKAMYLAIFAEGMKYHAEQQRAGRSPDSCTSVRNSFAKIPWP
jgi:hypothetical protein